MYLTTQLTNVSFVYTGHKVQIRTPIGTSQLTLSETGAFVSWVKMLAELRQLDEVEKL